MEFFLAFLAEVMARRVLNMARRAVVMGHSIGMAVVDVRLGRGDGEAGEVHSDPWRLSSCCPRPRCANNKRNGSVNRSDRREVCSLRRTRLCDRTSSLACWGPVRSWRASAGRKGHLTRRGLGATGVVVALPVVSLSFPLAAGGRRCAVRQVDSIVRRSAEAGFDDAVFLSSSRSMTVRDCKSIH